ncbi:MAG: hypothetical protein AB1757_08170 [Acidobacteriota bacterium]
MKYCVFRKILPNRIPFFYLAVCLSVLFSQSVFAQQTGNPSSVSEGAIATEPLPAVNLPELLREVKNKGAEIHKQMNDYTYTLKKTRRTLDGQGKAVDKEVQEFEAYPVRGEHVLIQLSKNGVALPAPEISQQRRQAGQALEKAERFQNGFVETRQVPPPPIDNESYLAAGITRRNTYLSIDPLTFLETCEFYAPRREQLNNRDTIVLNFRIKPTVKLPIHHAFVGRLIGTLWIDAMDKVLVRIDATPAPEFSIKALLPNSDAPDAQLLYEQTRVAEGVWLPTLIRLNAASNSAIFNGLNWDVSFEFNDYKRFKATAEDVKLQEKKEPL